MKENLLLKVLNMQKQGKKIGIWSACTANELVIEASMKHAIKTGTILLIEATANQVDQYGGYTGMTPARFAEMIRRLAEKTGFDESRLILGGDHLGPLTFSKYNADKAMAEAKELVRQYVSAGFTKIHIDTSMKVADDDPQARLSNAVIAGRGLELAQAAEGAYKELLKKNPEAVHPVYIVGSEVPIPGGAQNMTGGIQITKVEDFKNTVAIFEKSFKDAGLEEAWKHVIGVVVQPGIEEKDEGCTEYDRAKAADLMKSIREFRMLMFEGHSTDYQTKYKLRELVEDGVGILKVGPALTFALREGLFALAFAEKEAFRYEEEKQSRFMEVLDEAMLENPVYYQKYYAGAPAEIGLKRKYSFSDRCRYYLGEEKIRESIKVLFDNFRDGVPLNLLSQFMPIEYIKVREGELANKPEALVFDRVCNTIDEYLFATRQKLIG